MKKTEKIFVVGKKNIVETALNNHFRLNGFKNVLSDSACNIDLINQDSVFSFFEKERPGYVFLTNFIFGGIAANIKYPAEFIYKNLQIQNNVLHCSYKFGVKKLLFLGSSCSYPRDCAQPIKEEYLLSGKLEKTSEPYSIAKIAGIKVCQSYNKQYGTNFIPVIPASIYGPGDDFDLEGSHVASSLIRKFHEAKDNNELSVTVWGTGNPRREFIYVDDVVDACMFLMDNYNSFELINVGYGKDLSIKELALIIRDVVGFTGDIFFDDSIPDGTPQKLLDSSKMAKLGWKATVDIKGGIRRTYEWYKVHREDIKRMELIK